MNTAVETPLPAAGLGIIASQTHKFGTIFPSLARAAATYVSDAIDNPRHSGVRLFFNCTVVGAGPGTVTAKVQVQDPASLVWMDLAGAVTAALNANALTMLTIYPEGVAAANVTVLAHLGRKWRLSVDVAVNDVTFSVGGEYLTGA